MNLVDSVLGSPPANEETTAAVEDDSAAAAAAMEDDTNVMDEDEDEAEEELQVRSLEVPLWLSTPEVTSKFCGEIKYATLAAAPIVTGIFAGAVGLCPLPKHRLIFHPQNAPPHTHATQALTHP